MIVTSMFKCYQSCQRDGTFECKFLKGIMSV